MKAEDDFVFKKGRMIWTWLLRTWPKVFQEYIFSRWFQIIIIIYIILLFKKKVQHFVLLYAESSNIFSRHVWRWSICNHWQILEENHTFQSNAMSRARGPKELPFTQWFKISHVGRMIWSVQGLELCPCNDVLGRRSFRRCTRAYWLLINSRHLLGLDSSFV